MSDCMFGYQSFGFTQPKPNSVDFISMLRTEVGLTAVDIPDDSVYITRALAWSVHWVVQVLAQVDISIYLRAVYCLAADRLINYGIDTAGNCTFATLRKNFSIYSFQPGVISSSSDESSSQSFQVSEAFNTLSIPDLQNLKTPWGREYLSYAQQAAPIWGLS